MKKTIFYLMAIAFGVTVVTSCQDKSETVAAADETAQPANFIDSLSYYMGLAHADYVAASLKMYPKEVVDKIDINKFMAGFATALDVEKERVALEYGLNHGISFWQQNQVLKNAGLPVDNDILLAGFAEGLKADTIAEKTEIMESAEILDKLMYMVNSKIIEYQHRMSQEKDAARTASMQSNKEAGATYVAEQLKADPELKVSDTGLIYKMVAAGTGATPKSGKTVKVKYTGSFVDGEVFDSSEGQPVEFYVDGVVPGFREALLMMKKGGKMHIIVPDNLAYGNNAPPMIGPGQTLVFDIELVDVEE